MSHQRMKRIRRASPFERVSATRLVNDGADHARVFIDLRTDVAAVQTQSERYDRLSADLSLPVFFQQFPQRVVFRSDTWSGARSCSGGYATKRQASGSTFVVCYRILLGDVICSKASVRVAGDMRICVGVVPHPSASQSRRPTANAARWRRISLRATAPPVRSASLLPNPGVPRGSSGGATFRVPCSKRFILRRGPRQLGEVLH